MQYAGTGTPSPAYRRPIGSRVYLAALLNSATGTNRGSKNQLSTSIVDTEQPFSDRRTAAIVLAAGHGKRMGSNRPKVLQALAGRPMIDYVLDTLSSLGFGGELPQPVAIVGYRRDEVNAFIAERAKSVVQVNALGTGDAAKAGVESLEDVVKHILLIHGDEPLIDASTYRRMLLLQRRSQAAIVLLTGIVSDTQGLGRVVRDESGNVIDLVQQDELSEEGRRSKEINFGAYVFDRDFLVAALSGLQRHDSGEYYLTDVIGVAHHQNLPVLSVSVPHPDEQMGINTPDQLERAEEYLRGRANR